MKGRDYFEQSEIGKLIGKTRDSVKQELYDTITLKAGDDPQKDRRFFSNVSQKPDYLSNLTQNSQLEGKTSFAVLAIRVDAFTNHIGNSKSLPLLMEHSHISLRVGEKEYWRGPLQNLCSGIYMQNALAGQTGSSDKEHYSQLGVPKTGTYSLKGFGIVIEPVQQFFVDWKIEGMTNAEKALATAVADSKISFRFNLIGVLKRRVQ